MIPDHETIKQMMNELYNGFYLKWRNILTVENAGQMMQEVYELDKKYNCQLCRDILGGLVESIDQEIVRRSGNVNT